MGRISEGVMDSKDVRHIGSTIKIRLRTIHPNPGPRNKTDVGKEERRNRRKEKRREKRQRNNSTKIKEFNITTWNVQRMSLRTMNKRKARLEAGKAKK